MELFSQNGDFQRVKRAGRQNRYNTSGELLRRGLPLVHDVLLGRSALKAVGVGNLLKLAEESADTGEGFILAPDHLTDISVTAAAAIASWVADLQILVASTNDRIPNQRLVYELLDSDTIRRVPYGFPDGHYGEETNKKPMPFDGTYYVDVVRSIENGKTVVVAAHNPMTSHKMKNDGKLPDRPGKLAPHLALETGRPILPVLTLIQGQQINPNQLNSNSLDLSFLLKPKDVLMAFGDPIVPSQDDIKRYQVGSLEDRRKLISEVGHKVLDSLRSFYDDDLARRPI